MIRGNTTRKKHSSLPVYHCVFLKYGKFKILVAFKTFQNQTLSNNCINTFGRILATYRHVAPSSLTSALANAIPRSKSVGDTLDEPSNTKTRSRPPSCFRSMARARVSGTLQVPLSAEHVYSFRLSNMFS